MSVTLSLFAGAGAQFFDNSGNVLSGGKIYTYFAGTTTPLATYTSVSGVTPHTNPIVLNSAGRVPGGEIWSTLGVGYKFVLKTSTDVLIDTYNDIPSSAQPPAANDADSIMYEQGYTVTAGSFIVGKIYRIVFVGTTNFTLIGAVNNTIGTHFIATGVGVGTGTAELSQTVETNLRQIVSVKNFGAVGDGVADDTNAIQAAINSVSIAGGGRVLVPTGIYKTTQTITVPTQIYLIGENYGFGSRIVYTNASAANYIFSVTGPYNGIQGLYITTVNATLGAIYRQDCSNSKDEDLVIEGNFKYGWKHNHTGIGGYFNRHEKIFVTLSSSTYVDNVGIWCEGYYSASDFDSCSVTNCVVGAKFDFANAVTLVNMSAENCTAQGIYIGSQTVGMAIIAPYFEGNLANNSVYCEAGAANIDMFFARSSQSIPNSITSRNQININGGLTASFQKYGFTNTIKNPQGYLQATTGVPNWTANQSVVTRETSNTEGSVSAIKVTASAGANYAGISQQVFGRTTTNLYKTFTISGRYYVPTGQTTDSRFRVVGSVSGEVQAGLFTQKGSWQTFNDVFVLPATTEIVTIEIYAAWNAGGTTVGTEYVIVTDLCLIPGEYFVPNQVIAPYVTYQEAALVTTFESDYQQPIEFCGYTAISSGATTVTVTYPSWFAANVTKILNCVATCGSNTPQAIKAEPTTTNVVFTVPSAPIGSFKIWYSIKSV